MPDQTQELLELLAKVQERYPHWRFGQLVCNVASWAGGDRPGDAWDVSDADLMKAARDHLAGADDRRGGAQRAAV